MSSPTPSPNGNTATSSFQRVAIAAGVVIVVILTVVAALFLAAQEVGEEPTPVAVVSPTATPTHTPITPADSPTPTLLPTDTPSATPSATIEPPTSEPTTPPPPPATVTDTPPVPPTFTVTSTPLIIVVTPTPPAAPPATATSGVCQPPPDWVTYEVQRGDTLNSLAERTKVSVYDLQQVNCLDSFTLEIGQIIYLPFTPPTPTVTYTPTPTRRPGPTPTRTPTPTGPQIISVNFNLNEILNEAGDKIERTVILVIVQGKNFRPAEQGFRVELRGPGVIILELGEAKTSTGFEATASLAGELPSGTYDLVVINPNGRLGVKQAVHTQGATPPTPSPTPAPPDIVRFTPTSGKISEEVELIIQGRNFRPTEAGFRVELQATDGSQKVELDLGATLTDTSFEAIIRAGTLQQVGNYSLVVTNPDGQSDIASEKYKAIE